MPFFILTCVFSVAAFAQVGDANEDGTVDVLDRDAILDHLLRNTPLTGTGLANADANQDGVVDLRDAVFIVRADSDSDCVPDFLEAALGLDPSLTDTDNNGILDGDEDPDGDGLTNCEEVMNRTDPLSFDSDGDGFSDFDEVMRSSDPNDSQSVPISEARSSALSYRFFDAQESAASSGIQVSAPISYRFFDAQESAASSSIQVSAPISYRFFDGGAASGSGLFVLSQGVSYRL